MRALTLLPLVLLAAACGDAERHVYIIPMEGQSPPEPVAAKPTENLPKDIPQNSWVKDTPAYLRSNAPLEWTSPPGWDAELSTKPQQLVEFTIEKNGPGNSPIKFLILNGLDEYPSSARIKNIERWEAFYHEDTPLQITNSESNGVKITKYRIHGTYEGYPVIGSSEPINEPNWTMLCGYVEGPTGSIMYKFQGPDAIVKANESKVDLLLNSMKPHAK
jgi:hypothetical protein